MKTIIEEKRLKTPFVKLEDGIIELKGCSIPEDSVIFYKPIITWITQYAQTYTGRTKVNVKIDYFNTSSSKRILDCFKQLEILHNKGHEVIINWFFDEDDEDMYEACEDYSHILKIPFNLIEVEN